MNIEKNKVVSLSYNLSLPDADGELSVVEIVNADDPLLFLFGMSGLPEKFEEQLDGLCEGDAFDFTIDPEEGYGEYDDEAVVELDKLLFEVEGVDLEEMLQPGHIIPMTNEEGETLQGMVIDVEGEKVKMDFNHPLAGKLMRFEGKVLHIREATETELEHGHVHGEDGEEDEH